MREGYISIFLMWKQENEMQVSKVSELLHIN